MANGHAHALPLLEIPPETTNDQKIELEIGEAMALAMAWASYGVVHYEIDGLSLPPDIRTIGGKRIAKLYYLKQSYGAGFDLAAADAGKRAVRQQADAEYRAEHGTALPENILNILAEEVLACVHRVEAAMLH